MHSFPSCQKLLAVLLCWLLPQWANLSESTQLSCRWSWYLSGLVTCRTSTLLFSIPTASHSPVGQYPREKICKTKNPAAIVHTKYHRLYSSALGITERVKIVLVCGGGPLLANVHCMLLYIIINISVPDALICQNRWLFQFLKWYWICNRSPQQDCWNENEVGWTIESVLIC